MRRTSCGSSGGWSKNSRRVAKAGRIKLECNALAKSVSTRFAAPILKKRYLVCSPSSLEHNSNCHPGSSVACRDKGKKPNMSDQALKSLKEWLEIRLPDLQRNVEDVWDTLKQYGARPPEELQDFKPEVCNCDAIDEPHVKIAQKDEATLSWLGAITFTKDVRKALKQDDIVSAVISADAAHQLLGHATACILSHKGAQSKKRICTLLEQRHAPRNAVRSMVLSDWEKNISAYPSAEKAGRHYADWLQAQGHSYEPRTVRDWIRERAKEKGITFR